ncbi:Sulfur carrier protein ThiS [Vibrio stylophorae]|uniref:Sulfur carrier protein ThiS n=1 Tax=Vibrio stylophorae TaxID=659351 RepID=A0ABN8DPA6_9VIBR|nr:sulfur carrier protein ThiS [Vibrio stylophorae]CAH0532253.1 Sulfur carrier protein ThiS [Vibrio stylophorae]
MQVYVNDQAVELALASTLQQLIEQLSVPAHATAAACNGSIVPRSQWSETILNDGDQIALFQAIAGG